MNNEQLQSKILSGHDMKYVPGEPSNKSERLNIRKEMAETFQIPMQTLNDFYQSKLHIIYNIKTNNRSIEYHDYDPRK